MAQQPIIRGIQAVGSVSIMYTYNGTDNILALPAGFKIAGKEDIKINTSGGISIAGFRLDGEFLRAVQQIASSVVIPILGGGGVALTNNNRTGTLTLNCAKVSTPDPKDEGSAIGSGTGKMYTSQGSEIGVADGETVYDMVFIAQVQQAQPGGDSVGSTIKVIFDFCGLTTVIQFEGCTIATVDPIALTGNDAASYQVVINYLNWECNYSAAKDTTTV